MCDSRLQSLGNPQNCLLSEIPKEVQIGYDLEIGDLMKLLSQTLWELTNELVFLLKVELGLNFEGFSDMIVELKTQALVDVIFLC